MLVSTNQALPLYVCEELNKSYNRVPIELLTYI